MPDVCLFWDNSNIFHSAQKHADRVEGHSARHGVRMQFDHLLRVATAGRPLKRAYCVGSVPPELQDIWRRLEKDTGVRPELYERGKQSGTEQGLDQCLQVWMLRCSHDVTPPGVAVLMTGDGAGYSGGAGFHADLERSIRPVTPIYWRPRAGSIVPRGGERDGTGGYGGGGEGVGATAAAALV